MKYVLGLDFESTWTDPVDPRHARVVEIGAVLYDPIAKAPDVCLSRFVWNKRDPAFVYDPRMKEVCGISHEALLRWGQHPGNAFTTLLVMMDQAEAIVAHNGNAFDRPLLEAEADRNGFRVPEKMWIDTTVDLPFPAKIETRKLQFLAPEHGFINPFPHRALFDVLAMLRVMSCYPFDHVMARAAEPSVVVRAVVPKPYGPSGDGGAGVAAAKARGYRFSASKKWWVKTVKQSEVPAELSGLRPYKVELVEV